MKIIRMGLICLFFCFFTPAAWADLALNMPYGVTPVSHDIYRLHMTALIICCLIALIVFGLIAYSIIMFRKSRHAVPAQFSENRLIEIIWTTIPFLILIALAIPATRILADIHNTDESAITIKITGHQWKWEYEYLDNGVRFFSYLSTPLDQIYGHAAKSPWFLLEVDKPMLVPVNTKVKLLITSDDVIHSWWVPELGIKQDAIPGFINENWINVTAPGEYRGQCAELCGVNHGFMPIVVKAVSQDEYNQWLNQQRTAMQTQQPPRKTDSGRTAGTGQE
ncbi:Cytochrome c oxidase subunit 2 [Aquicella siphonis]|uniref:Cytochrome c oxidase subunit 2 n=1 Tax=Aquicella siphonis TaxID=254247 RepID=A0A5E4PGD4_9COXI|nr:cytochrome c oxidase subunit II [Aquicella siphonis]VVC75578.1 Cytochrome c oxidase subunit 2 [Aquicella siphonis]